MDTNNGQIGEPTFNCIICNYKCSKKYHYERHISSSKHTKNTKRIQILETNGQEKFKCDCGKEYKFSQGLSKHKKNCNFKKEESTKIDTNMIIDIIKENQEIKKLLIEQNNQVIELHKENNILNKENNKLINKLVEKESVTTTINNNNTTNNNQKFNLNIFLNENCKDAMNLKEFIDNIKITFQELLTIGDAGFVNGVSDIFIKRLKDLEITKRPIHCTDIKRDTIYLKEDDGWNKDDKENTKIKRVIERVEYKNLAALHNWCKENPESKVNNSKDNLLRDKIHLQVLQGDGNTREKVIKNITKTISIDKQIV